MTPEGRDRHIRAIIEREGGWVDDPDDSGGPTNYGITLAMWRAYCKTAAAVSVSFSGADIRHTHSIMSEEGAMRFYRWYFDTQGLDELIDEFGVPDDLVPLVMDMRTLHSLEGCRKILGRAIDSAHGGYAREFITLSRIRYMLEVAERSPKDRKYVRGWMHRALKAIGMWPPATETTEV